MATKKLTTEGLRYIFSLMRDAFVPKSDYDNKISAIETDIKNAENAMSEALNGIDVTTQELVEAGLAKIELTLAAAWDDLDRRIKS